DDGTGGPTAPLGEGPGNPAAGSPAGGSATSRDGGQYAVPAMTPEEQYAQTLKERRLSSSLMASIEQPERAQGAAQAVANPDDAFLSAIRASMPANYGKDNGDEEAPQKSSLENSLESVNTSM